jgi:bifunctional pyridoxal-dependent enzyme with beta-cystathionase and maltose regulon repressor activities
VLDAGRWVLDFDLIKKTRARLAYLCNPQNPGGTVFTRDELTRFAELVQGAIIVSDEIHCDLVLDAGKRHVPIASLAPEISRRTVTLMSANKAFNFPAAGCAWAIAEDPGLREAMAADVRAHVLPSPSVFGYVATLAAFRSGDAWLQAQLEYLRANRDLVEQRVALPIAHVEATYLAWIDCSGLKAGDPYEHFLRHGVALSPGAQFGAPRFVRLNFGTQRARLEQALERMTRAVSSAG